MDRHAEQPGRVSLVSPAEEKGYRFALTPREHAGAKRRPGATGLRFLRLDRQVDAIGQSAPQDRRAGR